MELNQVGITLIFIGITIIFLGMILNILGEGKGKTKSGGVIIVGPFPIIWGTDSKIIKVISIISLIIIIIMLANTLLR